LVAAARSCWFRPGETEAIPSSAERISVVTELAPSWKVEALSVRIAWA